MKRKPGRKAARLRRRLPLAMKRKQTIRRPLASSEARATVR